MHEIYRFPIGMAPRMLSLIEVALTQLISTVKKVSTMSWLRDVSSLNVRVLYVMRYTRSCMKSVI